MRDIRRSKTERELVRVKIYNENAFWNEIRVNAGVSKLMLLSFNLVLPVLVYAARHSLIVVRHKLMLPGITYYCWVFANMNRPGKGFSGKVIPLFQTMMVQASEDMGEDLAAPIDSYSTPIITQPSSSKSQKKKVQKEAEEGQCGEDRLQLTKLMTLCTKLQKHVLDLEEAKTAQAKEIASLKKRVKQLEKRRKSRTSGLKRLRKVSSVSRVESSYDVSLGTQEDASKQGRKIANLDADAEVTLIDEIQERFTEEMLFDVQDDLQGEEVVAKKEVAEKEVSVADPITTVGEVVTTANVEVTTASAPTTTIDELNLAQTLIEIKAAKPKNVTSAATTTITTRPKARGVVVQEISEFKTTSSPSQALQLP
ncbi:hypothetical protein Tco_0721988 [Tanacetum coccineum]